MGGVDYNSQAASRPPLSSGAEFPRSETPGALGVAGGFGGRRWPSSFACKGRGWQKAQELT